MTVPALAQIRGGGSPDPIDHNHPGSWVEHDSDEGGSTTGHVSNTLTPSTGTPYLWGWDIYDLYGDASSGFGFGDGNFGQTHYDAGSIDMHWTKTIVMRWEDADGNLTSNPPDHQIFRVGATAGASFGADTDFYWLPQFLLAADLGTAAVSADNGLGDDAKDTSSYGYPLYATGAVSKLSSGWHLKPKDSSSGEVTITVSGSAQSSGQHVSPGVCDWPIAGGYVYPVTTDSREATLVAMGHGITYHKGVQENADGTDYYDPTTGDTVTAPEANTANDNSLQVDIGLPIFNYLDSEAHPHFYSVSYKGSVQGGAFYPQDSVNTGDTYKYKEDLKNNSDGGTMPLPASDEIRSSDPFATTWDIPALKVLYSEPDVSYGVPFDPTSSQYYNPKLDMNDAQGGDDVKFTYTFQ